MEETKGKANKMLRIMHKVKGKTIGIGILDTGASLCVSLQSCTGGVMFHVYRNDGCTNGVR